MRIALIAFVFFQLFFSAVLYAQSKEPFENYGPPNTISFYSLKDAFKHPETTYKLKLSGLIEDTKHLNKIGQLSNLQSLCLIDNKLDSLPEGLSAFKSLLYFESKENKLNQIKPEMAMEWRQLSFFKVVNASLDSLPETVGAWGNIASIELQGIISKDTFKFPKDVKYWKNMNDLLFYSVNIVSLPSSFNSMTKLKNMVMVKCNLNHLPRSLNSLKSLEELVLDDNKFDEFPECINGMYSLTYLSIQNNSLKKISENISNLQKLKTLNIKGNAIEAYDIEILKVLLPNCKIIY